MATNLPEPHDEPCYIISVAAKLVQMHPQTLRYYERLGLIKPARSEGKIRLYSVRDVERLRQIHQYIHDLGVNLAGAEVIMRLTERLNQRELELETTRSELMAEIWRLRQALGESVEGHIIDQSQESAPSRPTAKQPHAPGD